jgi:hypothetical protein
MMDKKYKVFDNCVPNQLSNDIEMAMTGDSFPWFYTNKSVYTPDQDDRFDDGIHYKDKCSLGHAFTLGEPPKINSIFYGMIVELLETVSNSINIKCELLRARANYTYPISTNQTDIPFSPHIDGDYEHKVLLYYVNDSDGDTLLFDNDINIIDRISPRKGRFIIFNGDLVHAACAPKVHENRIVINYNLKLDYDYN